MRKLIAGTTLGLLMGWSASGAELPEASPESLGFDSAALAEVANAARASGQPIHSLTVVRKSAVLFDADFYPFDGGLHDAASVTKSVTTTLVGIAAEERLLDLDAPMLSFFPDLEVANRDDRKERVTVRQLAGNVSGLACIGAPAEVTLAEMQANPDFLQFALDLPMAHEPGTHFDYCSPGMHILSAIVQAVAGVTAADYAQAKLFGPLGISDAIWEADPQGISRGWGDLHLTSDDMVLLGLLWLQGGAWDGRQLIPADWLQQATTQGVPTDEHEDYGAGFWVGPRDEPIAYYYATGRGGQRILVAPPLDLVIVTTGGGFDPGDIIDPLVGTLRDPAGSLPPNPSGEARLAAAIAGAAEPPGALAVPDLPPMAAAISGRTYRFPANPYGVESFEAQFPGGAEAVMTLAAGGEAIPRPVGLDGVFRWSAGDHGIRIGDAAQWQGDDTLVIDHNSIGDIRAYTISARFSGETVDLTIVQRDEPMSVMLTGTAAD